MVAQRVGLNMEQAFSTLRNHARTHNLRLVNVAHDVVDGTVAASALAPRRPNHPEQQPTPSRRSAISRPKGNDRPPPGLSAIVGGSSSSGVAAGP